MDSNASRRITCGCEDGRYVCWVHALELNAKLKEANELLKNERERCAKVCEEYARSSWEDHKDADAQYAGKDCAAEIRALPDTGTQAKDIKVYNNTQD